jgi:adenylate kinase family enzyme
MPISVAAVDALAASDRILVLGPSGSGKTWLTLRLAQLLQRPAVHLDACFWRPGWIATPQDQWRAEVGRLVEAPQWIMDGTYESTLAIRLAVADAVIVLERSRWACTWGVVRRALLQGDRPRPDAPPGQPIDRAFLRYIWQYPGRTRPQVQALLEQHGRDKIAIVLQRSGDLDRLLDAVRSSLRRPSVDEDARQPRPQVAG